MEAAVYDVISWVGLAICIGAFFIKDVFWLRLATLIGCALMFIYYLFIAIPQGVISNLLVLLINAYYLGLFAWQRHKTNQLLAAEPDVETVVTTEPTPTVNSPASSAAATAA
ncbi:MULTISPECIES: hypothetical protein [Alkalimonas]|uniref:Nicotinamide riboside transporter PnuC n=1 Tax=Alkalimonas mucilaginosa TaxID=3057676 RepID=A0ABU7JG55_9GAMM|nr:hypothetical protein [Alkalimonas sp. MEB004]MEE2024674.1 hypothetical protein [Alkalimonas sp. MEB004]